jgi:hypothetical protein
MGWSVALRIFLFVCTAPVMSLLKEGIFRDVVEEITLIALKAFPSYNVIVKCTCLFAPLGLVRQLKFHGPQVT